MGDFGIDFAWGRPSVPALHANGVRFVGRYFSYDAGKNIDRAEYEHYRSEGIGVVVAWETLANRATAGFSAGFSDAIAARQQRKACGMPESQPIYLAVDFDAEGPEVYHYFQGAKSVLGNSTGAYGGYRVVKYLFDNNVIAHAWQTYAWSGGLWDRRAAVRQYSNDHTLGGVSCDYDVAIAPVVPSPSNPLDVLIPAERHRVERYDALNAHRWRHPVATAKVRRELVRKRQEVWTAANRGLGPRREQVPRGWNVRNRAARYAILLSRTKGLR